MPTNKIINLNSPILEVVEAVNTADIKNIIALIDELDGTRTFLSSCKDVNLLLYLKFEIEKELRSLIDSDFDEVE
jgi:hypothetical protein